MPRTTLFATLFMCLTVQAGKEFPPVLPTNTVIQQTAPGDTLIQIPLQEAPDSDSDDDQYDETSDDDEGSASVWESDWISEEEQDISHN